MAARRRHAIHVRGSDVGESMDAAKRTVFHSSALKQASDHASRDALVVVRALSQGRFTSASAGYLTSTQPAKQNFPKGKGATKIVKAK
jgi:hypothetical protein